MHQPKEVKLFNKTKKTVRMGCSASVSITLLEAKAYYITDTPIIAYPEDQIAEIAAKNTMIGIALSGGGTRAACFSLGFLRALNDLGLLQKAKYISSISGGSWTACPLAHSPSTSLSTFLGERVEESACTLVALEKIASQGHAAVLSKTNFIPLILKKFGGNIPVTLANGLTNATSKGATWEDHEVDFWSKAVGEAFFHPYNIDTSSASLPSLSEPAQLERTKQCANGWIKKIYPTRPMKSFPFPIVNGSVLEGGPRGCVPLEFTPLYYGVPLPKSIYSEGGLIEPFAYTSIVTENNTDPSASEQKLTVQQPPYILSTFEMSGISSSNLAQTKGDKLSDRMYSLANFPVFQCALSEGKEKKLVDGGSTDNTGTLTLVFTNLKIKNNAFKILL